METYKIEGNITYNQADTEDGFATVEILEYQEAENATEALEKFLEDNTQYDFFGKMTMCDADTRGEKWARYADQNEDQFISVDIVE
jgi:hypothetical protein